MKLHFKGTFYCCLIAETKPFNSNSLEQQYLTIYFIHKFSILLLNWLLCKTCNVLNIITIVMITYIFYSHNGGVD